MPIAIGQHLPAVRLKHVAEGGLDDISTDRLFDHGTSVIFGIAGCYTPTCSSKHLPSFVANHDALREKGVDRIACLSVNDPFVMHEWLKAYKSDKEIIALPDGNAQLTRALGLEMDGSAYGLGVRTQRFAMVVKDGIVTHLAIDQPGVVDVSSAEAVLKVL